MLDIPSRWPSTVLRIPTSSGRRANLTRHPHAGCAPVSSLLSSLLLALAQRETLKRIPRYLLSPIAMAAVVH